MQTCHSRITYGYFSRKIVNDWNELPSQETSSMLLCGYAVSNIIWILTGQKHNLLDRNIMLTLELSLTPAFCCNEDQQKIIKPTKAKDMVKGRLNGKVNTVLTD